MIRTQVQLEKEQLAALKQRATREGVSVAELIRRGISRILEGEDSSSQRQLRVRAIDAAGRYGSGKRNVSRRHDKYLAEHYRS